MRRALFLMAIAFTPVTLWAQGEPLGPEFRVNTYTTNEQTDVAVSQSKANGDFLVVWASDGQDGSGLGIYGQRHNGCGGVPLGSEFRVNTYTTGSQRHPSVVAPSILGNYVVVWESEAEDGSSGGIFGQRYALSGLPLGPEFRVNTFTTLQQVQPSVGISGNGDFVVVWSSKGQDGQDYGVFGQRYAVSGAPLGGEFQVNTYTTGYQSHPDVACVPSFTTADCIVVWTSQGQDGSSGGVFGQRLLNGAPTGPEFRVNSYTTGYQGDVSIDDGGQFVAAWSSDGQDGSDRGVFAQRFSSFGGFPEGPEFRVNTYTAGYQGSASVGFDGSGFVIVWSSNGQDGSSSAVFGQRYNLGMNGIPDGPEFRVNTYTTGAQELAAAAAETGNLAVGGRFVVVWQSNGQDGSGNGVFGQCFEYMTVPVKLMDATIE